MPTEPQFLIVPRTCALLAAGWLSLPGSAHAARVDTIRKHIADNRLEQAQAKCEKWAVQALEDEEALRDACAEAWWPVAEAADRAADWSGYREKWAGTSWAPRAKQREAAAVVRELNSKVSADEIGILLNRFADTDSAGALEEAMLNAAIRDARTGDAARAVAQRWPDHPRLPELVSRFPGSFVQIQFEGRMPVITTEPAIPLEGPYAPQTRWVAINPNGSNEVWDVASRKWLANWGIPETVSASVPVATDGGPSIPFCSVPGLPRGAGPGLEVQVEFGIHVHPMKWEPGCRPDDWPAFIVFTEDRLTGISLRPGHYVDLIKPKIDDRKTIRGYLGTPVGIPQLHAGVILQQLGPAWIADPVSGGMPWATARPPSARSLPLTTELKSAPIPGGWSLEPAENALVVKGTPLATMPEQLRNWTLHGSEARVVPHLVRGTFGLRGENAVSQSPSAPILGPAGGWKRTPDGTVLREPPTGADIAGIREVDTDSIEAALGVAAGVGLARDRVQPLDGWKVDVDGDGTAEVVIRAQVDNEGAVIVIDPLEGKEAFTADTARVFAFQEPMVLANGRAAGLPFSFRKGPFVYMAWSAVEAVGRTQRTHSLVVVRTDGTGIRSESWALPTPE
ncbi:MAG: hypothetical protein CL927_09335 [Deltaproteobacteria bacterium]|nr:hypothetical protein [Deltaproteobacteria bacterium]HCH66260.1 hypothetical protein [Deltaproteobacteria bacterium]